MKPEARAAIISAILYTTACSAGKTSPTGGSPMANTTPKTTPTGSSTRTSTGALTPTPTPTPTSAIQVRGELILDHPDSALTQADPNRRIAFISGGLLGVCDGTDRNTRSCGYLNLDGNIAIPLNFEEVTPFSGNYAAVELKGVQLCEPDSVIINRSGAEVTTRRNLNIHPAWADRFIISPGDDSCLGRDTEFIGDPSGTALTPLDHYLGSKGASHGLGLVWRRVVARGLYWFVDATAPSSGIAQSFSDANLFSEGLAAVCLSSGDCGFINTKGEWVLDGYDSVSSFRYGRAIVGLTDVKYGMIDRAGTVIAEYPTDTRTILGPNLLVYYSTPLKKFVHTDWAGNVISSLDGIPWNGISIDSSLE